MLQTRITTKYKLSKLISTSTSAQTPSTSAPEPIRGTLVLKTYDPVSGATLKYETNKAAEVGRLIQILGRLARPMSGLAEKEEGLGDAVEESLEKVEKAVEKVEKIMPMGGNGKKGKKKGKK
ncbi:hypothetical protein B7494_g4239 [Chlorociboria aeruginascens]|nr:hypothetical protein B7494_g4239 [Chlorociboria aeruginascens]